MARQTREGRRISEALLDELLTGRDPSEVFRDGSLLDDLKTAVAERALDAEMEAHLGHEREQSSGNHRNGHNRKRVLTDDGALDLEVPRDRQGRFEPQLGLRPCGWTGSGRGFDRVAGVLVLELNGAEIS